MDLARWKAQLRKGAAELAVLAVLERGDSYGLAILEAVQGSGGLEISEGSIYPLLNRLQRDGKISPDWVEDEDASHPRKYYTLTAEGRRALTEMRDVWAQFQRDMAAVLGPESSPV
jgi:PadR family transcriptional regulator PadR